MKTKMYCKTEIRLAKKIDLLVARSLLRVGQPYYIKSVSGRTFSGVYVIDVYTSSVKMQELFNANRVYIPEVPFHEEIHFNLKQTDLKEAMNYGH